jgi:hypothetical protein
MKYVVSDSTLKISSTSQHQGEDLNQQDGFIQSKTILRRSMFRRYIAVLHTDPDPQSQH